MAKPVTSRKPFERFAITPNGVTLVSAGAEITTPFDIHKGGAAEALKLLESLDGGDLPFDREVEMAALRHDLDVAQREAAPKPRAKPKPKD